MLYPLSYGRESETRLPDGRRWHAPPPPPPCRLGTDRTAGACPGSPWRCRTTRVARRSAGGSLGREGREDRARTDLKEHSTSLLTPDLAECIVVPDSACRLPPARHALFLCLRTSCRPSRCALRGRRWPGPRSVEAPGPLVPRHQVPQSPAVFRPAVPRRAPPCPAVCRRRRRVRPRTPPRADTVLG